MTQVAVVPSAQLSDHERPRLRALLDEAFEQRFSDEDWDHCLGGWHVLARVDAVPVAHAAVVLRDIEVGGQVVRAGYLEGVAVLPRVQGRAHGARVVSAAMDVIRRESDLGVLSTGHPGFFERLGWERWQGPAYVIRDGTHVRTADEDDGIMVLRFGASRDLPLAAAIACWSRPGDDW